MRQSNATPLTSITYRADIDGLRAVAVGLVIAFHAFPMAVPGGFVGVDVFFVISGFLITSIIVTETRGRTFSLAGFYARRARRLFPALIVVMASVAVAGYFLLLPDELKALGKHLAAGAVYLSNFALKSEAGYFDAAAETKPLLHLWSLAIEEQFYLAWPLLLIAVGGERSRLALVSLVLLASLAASVLITPQDQTAAFYMPHTRVWELAVGALLALLMDGRDRLSLAGQATIASVLSLAGVALIACSALWLSRKTPFPGTWALLPTLGAALIIAAGPQASVNRWVLSAKPFVAAGLISYPLYLWHWPLLSFPAIIDPKAAYAPAFRVGAVAIAFLLAALTHVLVERPLLRRSENSSALGLAGVLSCLGLFGVALYGGWTGGRAGGSGVDLLVDATRDWQFPKGLTRRPAQGSAEVFARPGSKPAIVLLGDSNMQQYWPRLAAHRSDGKLGREIVFATNGGCPPLPGVVLVSGKRCDGFGEEAFAIAAKPGIGTVVIAAQWQGYFHSRQYRIGGSGGAVLARGAPSVDVAIEGLQIAMASLSQQGKDVWLILNIPVGPELDPKARIERSWSGIAIKSAPLLDRKKLDAALGSLKAKLKAAAAASGARVIDPMDHLCDERHCPAADADGRPRYKDGTHLAATYTAERATFLDAILATK